MSRENSFLSLENSFTFLFLPSSSSRLPSLVISIPVISQASVSSVSFTLYLPSLRPFICVSATLCLADWLVPAVAESLLAGFVSDCWIEETGNNISGTVISLFDLSSFTEPMVYEEER